MNTTITTYVYEHPTGRIEKQHRLLTEYLYDLYDKEYAEKGAECPAFEAIRTRFLKDLKKHPIHFNGCFKQWLALQGWSCQSCTELPEYGFSLTTTREGGYREKITDPKKYAEWQAEAARKEARGLTAPVR